MTDTVDSHAAGYAQLLALSGAPEAAVRSAVALAEGLFPHQIEGVAFLLGRRRAILADDMGLGKTRQSIVSLHHLAPAAPRLVVCPASVKRNWAREIALVTPDASILVIEGTAPVPLTAEWVIVNYDILGRHFDDLLHVPWAALVFDEAHYLKNHTSARSKLSRQLTTAAAAATPALAVQLLTGTPLTSRPRDLFVLLQLAAHPLGRSFLSFAKRYCAAEKGEYGWKTGGASNVEELTVQLHGVMLRRSKDDVLALPPKLRTWLPVEVPPGTGVRAIKKVFELLAGKDERPAQSRDVEFRRRGKLLAFLVEVRQALAAAKAAATIDFVRGAIDQGEKVIVFSCFEIPIQKLAAEFGDTAVVVTGKTPAAMRQPLVDRFQNDADVRVFAANIIAGGTGLNLTAATQVVFNDLDWVPTNHWQAEDRAYRIGQTRTVNVTYFVARNTIDDFVQAVLETKASLINAIVEGSALAPDSGGDVLDELQRILHALPIGGDVATGAPGGRCGDLGIAAPRVRRVPERAPRRSAPYANQARRAGASGARACAGRAGQDARGSFSASISHVQHVSRGCRLRDRGRRCGRHVQLPGLRVSGAMPPRARGQGRARGGRAHPGEVCGSNRRVRYFRSHGNATVG